MFNFRAAPSAAAVDRVQDFDVVDDVIGLSAAKFQGLSEGALDEDAFRDGLTNAPDAEDRVIYDRPTGRLFYDSDGPGGTNAVLFARLDPGTALDYLNIFVTA